MPTYGKPGSITSTPTPKPSASTTQQSDGSSTTSSPRTKTILGLVGILLLVGGAGSWLLLRRKR